MTDQGIVNRLILEADNHAAARDRLYMECARLTKVVEDLGEKLVAATAERAHAVSALSEQVDKVRAERDEARRMLCEDWAAQDGLPLDWQGRRGAEGMAEFVKWDCFNEENTNV